MHNGTFAKSYIRAETSPKRVSNWLKSSTLIVMLVILALALSVFAAFLRREGLIWLIEIKSTGAGELGSVAIVLAPLLALALAIERLIETFFDLFEQTTKEVAKLGSAGVDALNWFQNELDRAWKAAEEAASELGQQGIDESAVLLQLETAEQRIIKANNRITGLTKDPKYISTKRMLSIWIGLLLGLVVATLSDVGVFELLQIGVPRLLDMLVTGFVIGAGSGPVHSLVGILQGTKDTLANIGALASLGALRQQIEVLQSQTRK